LRLGAKGTAPRRPERVTGGEGRGRGEARTSFAVEQMPRVQRLLAVQDGDLLEVEQWGGWAFDCPPICGLWGNVWRGTGLAMRVSRPFASLSKITAVVSMLLAVGKRGGDAAVAELTTHFGLGNEVAASRARYAEASAAEALAHALLTAQHPCEGADPGKKHRQQMERWLRLARRNSPAHVVRDILSIGSDDGEWYMGDAAQRLALHWTYAICGVGAWHARGGLGWDGILAALACILGHRTVVRLEIAFYL